jgi:hypothetical protein
MNPAIARNNLSNLLGVDLNQLRTLLAVYIKQDLRGGKAFRQSNRSEYITSNRSMLLLVAIYTFMGFAPALTAFVRIDGLHIDVFFYSIVALSFTLFMVALAILAESGNVLFNETEIDVIGHLPVSPRTLFAAKALNLMFFSLLLSVASNLFPAICGLATERANLISVPAHLISAVIIAMFATAVVVVSHSLFIRYLSKERFDNLIAYCQAGLTVIFFLGYQLLPRMLDTYKLGAAFKFHWYFLFYPPVWFSGITLLFIGEINTYSTVTSAIALISMLALVTVALRKMSMGYISFISKPYHGYIKGKATEESTSKPSKGREYVSLQIFRSTLLRRPAERAVFDLVRFYLKRNREIKVRLYPSLAYVVVIPLIGFITEGLPDPFLSQELALYPIIGAAILCLMAQTAVEGMIFSEDYNAAWIFRAAPVASLGDVHGGIRKAVVFFIVLPGFIILFVLYTILWHSPLHSFMVLAPWLIITPTTLVISFLFREVIPLSVRYQKGQQTSRNFVILAFGMIGLSFVGVFQVFALNEMTSYWIFLACLTAVSVALYFILKKLSGESRPLLSKNANKEE